MAPMGLNSDTLLQMSTVKVSISLVSPYCTDYLHSQIRKQAFVGQNKFGHKVNITRGQIIVTFK